MLICIYMWCWLPTSQTAPDAHRDVATGIYWTANWIWVTKEQILYCLLSAHTSIIYGLRPSRLVINEEFICPLKARFST